jgi:hypothetical protein
LILLLIVTQALLLLAFHSSCLQALLVNAINFTAVLNTLPVALVLPADWNYTAFIEPCLAAVPIPFRPPRTGPAAAAIICAILALGLLGTYLWWVVKMEVE